MNFEIGHIFHIYNQGNNRAKIFFSERNYLFFVEKIRRHILPYADVLAWCLMPNHFHLMVYVRSRSTTDGNNSSDAATSSRATTTEKADAATSSRATTTEKANAATSSRATTTEKADAATSSHATTIQATVTTFNKSIGIMLTSYTRAINIQENRSGSLFRPHTKAICLTEHKGITPAFVDTKTGTMIYRSIKEKEYPLVCFNYIHQNPVEAKLVVKPEDWPHSSAAHYTGKLDDGLTNVERAKEFELA